MTETFVRVRVRCKSCRHAALLAPEHYKLLVQGARLELYCPRCSRLLAFDPLHSGAKPTSPALPAMAEAEKPVEQPVTAPVPAAPAFPPPPFAPLAGGVANPLPDVAAAPAFAPLAAGPSAPQPAAPDVATRDRPKLTLNERWKRLPQWAQWLVIGVVVVILGVVIFAMPMGGSNGSTPEQPTTEEHRP